MGREWLSEKDARELLENLAVGHLSMIGPDGYPYCIPVNYAVDKDKIYIHGALKGKKIDSINADHRVCFTADMMDGIIRQKEIENACDVTTGYSSVVVFGKARLIDEVAERLAPLQRISEKYTPDMAKLDFPEEMLKITAIIEITIEKITGKRRSPKPNEHQPR
jgi:nitroimidazol reductase NimA-like FMN-containing flavoprotein (pyridoxamine 5'-phosphate oxidase superfamily)